MLIDFESIYQKYMKGASLDGVWRYEPVNPSNPRAGKHLSTYQVFSNAGLGVALYLRNDFEGTVATRVHAGLKLIFSRKVRETFLLQKDDQKITITLDMGGVRALYAWLQGEAPSLSYEIVRPDSPKKQLAGFESDLVFPLTIRATESDLYGSGRSISVGLSDADIFHLEVHCLALAKLLYPSLSDVALLSHLKPRARASATLTAHVALQDPAGPADAFPQASPIHGVPASVLDPERTRKAVFAVGKSKWPKKDLATIEHIQSGPLEAMDRFVKDGNVGNFEEWDRLFAFLQGAQR